MSIAWRCPKNWVADRSRNARIGSRAPNTDPDATCAVCGIR